MTEEYKLSDNAPSYEEKYEQPQDFATLLWNRFNDLKHEMKVQLPCKVLFVNHLGNEVTVQILDKDHDGTGNIIDFPPIPNVPIRQALESGSAFIRLPVQIGDIGTIEFFDSSVDDIVESGIHTYSYEQDWHNLSDGIFTNGFLPKGKLYPISPVNPISIGTKTGTFLLSVDVSGSLVITAPSIILNGKTSIVGDIDVTGKITSTKDVLVGSVSLKSHTHSNGNNGSPTGGPM